MNTIQLECFIAVAEHLNFSRASQALKITQPAVSHQIQSLEEELEVKLFRRTSKSVSLTPEGLQFLPDAELILKTAFSAKERLGRHESLIPLEIGCHDRMALELLPDLFHQLALEFPLLRPSVRMVPFPSLLGLVENQKISAAFDFKEGQKKSALRFKALSSAPIACVCTPDHPLAQYEVLTKDMLQGNLVVCSSRLHPEPSHPCPFSGAAVLHGQHRHCLRPCKGSLRLHPVSGCASGPGSRASLYPCPGSPGDCLWDLLPV